MNPLLLRWSFGDQDTTQLNDFVSKKKFMDVIWLMKLSILSFQKWFPDAKFMVFYNGNNFQSFIDSFNSSNPKLLKEVEFIDQVEFLSDGKIINRYHFFPMGVWWKWVPFRYDISYNEISIDTDIICISEPTNLMKWLNSEETILIAPERFDKIKINTCGDLWNHPVLKGKNPLNCGIVGHKAGSDYSDRFYESSEIVNLGDGHNSFFINEQGVINIWVYSLELEGVKHFTLDFNLNAWARDFIYFIKNGVNVETIHATSWYKTIIYGMKSVFEKKVNGYYETLDQFLFDIYAGCGKLDPWSQYVIRNQVALDGDNLKDFHIIA